jgi:hypothetical protein
LILEVQLLQALYPALRIGESAAADIIILHPARRHGIETMSSEKAFPKSLPSRPPHLPGHGIAAVARALARQAKAAGLPTATFLLEQAAIAADDTVDRPPPPVMPVD